MSTIVANDRVAPNTITGARGPEDLADGRIIPDVKDELIHLTNAGAPLTVLSDRKDGKSAKVTTQYAFKYGEVDILPLEIVVASAALAGDTTITLDTDHNKRVTSAALYRHPSSGEIIRCTVDPTLSTADITVTRAWGASSGAPGAAPFSAGDKLFYMGHAHGDGGSKSRIVSTQEVLREGFTQIFRTPLGVTGRNANTRAYFGKDKEQQKILRKREHLRAIDIAGFYSVKHDYNDPTTGHLVTTSDSLNNRIVSKTATLAEADMNYDLVCDIAYHAMKDGDAGYSNDGSKVKYWFGGMDLQTRLDKMLHASVWYDEDVSIPGIKLRGIKTSAGTLMFVYTPVLDQMKWEASSKTWYDTFIVDMNHIMLRFHEGRDTKLLSNRQDPSEDAEISEYMSDKGWQVENEAAHMKVTLSK